MKSSILTKRCPFNCNENLRISLERYINSLNTSSQTSVEEIKGKSISIINSSKSFSNSLNANRKNCWQILTNKLAK